MPQVSRHKLSKEAEKQLIQSLQLILSAINNQEEMGRFLGALLTDVEKLMLAKRLAMIVLLKEGLSDTEIANALHVTRMTVAKTKYYYEAQGRGYEVAMEKLEKDRQLQQAKKLLLSTTRYAIRAAGGHVKPGILD